MAYDVTPGWLDQSLASLWRRDTVGLGSGLSRALAARLGVDVVLVRVAFVVLAFCSGLGVALYAWGTLLTPGPQGQVPIDSTLPRMRTWSCTARIAMVVVTSVGVVCVVGALTSLPWGLAILAGALLVWWLRRNRATLVGSTQPMTADGLDDDALIADWRSRMSSAVNRAAAPAALPAADLHPRDPTPVVQATASSWLGAVILMGVAGASTVVALAFGLSPAVAVALGTGVLGLGALVFAAVSRAKRLPRPILAVMLVPLVLCGWLATGAGAKATTGNGSYEVRVFGDRRPVDLTSVDLTGVSTIEIAAVGSEVEVLVPGIPENGFSVDKTASIVTLPDTSAGVWEGVSVSVDAVASEVHVVEAPHG